VAGVVVAGMVLVQLVQAAPPTADFFISNSTPLVGQSVTFTSTVTDPDNDVTEIAWDFDYDGAFATDETGTQVTHAYSTAGARTVALRVTDGTAGPGPDPDPVDVVLVTHALTVEAPNAAPTASFTATPSTAQIGQTVNFDGTGSSDSDGTVVRYEWDLDGNGSFETDTGTDATTSRAYTTPGPVGVKLRVTDNDGAGSAVATKAMTVNNAPPTAAFTATPDPAQISQTITFNGTGSNDNGDPGGSIVRLEWDFAYDGTFTAEATGSTATHSYTTSGGRTVALRVTDNNGATDTAVKAVMVNAPPIAVFTIQHSVTPGLPDVGEPVTLDAGGPPVGSRDTDGTITKYEWDLDGNGSFETNSGATRTSPPHTYTSAGVVDVKLRVTDNTGATAVAMQPDLTVNAPPVSKIVFAASPLSNAGQNPLLPLVGAPVAFAGAALAPNGSADAEGPISAYAWDLDNDGQFDDDLDANAQRAFQNAGEQTVRLRVTDSDQSTSVASVVVRVNTKPVASFVADKLTPVTNEAISFFAGIEDPDPDTLQNPNNGVITKWEWDLDYDGTTFTVDKSGQNIQHSYPTAGVKTVRLRVTDGGGATTELEKAITVANTRPNALFDYSPTDPLAGQPVRFDSRRSTPTAGKEIKTVEWDFDYDGQTFTPDLGGPPTEHNLVSHSFATAGQKTVAVKVTEIDGGDDTESKTLTVNAPPEASFRISSGAPFTGDAVTFSSTSRDPDGPLASQAWDTDNDGQFDDSAGAVASRSFGSSGSYTVRLLVVDSKGATAVSAGRVDVRARPVPPPPPPPALRVLSADVDIQGSFTRKWTKITRLIVNAPVGARVGQRCKGRGCPKRLKTLRMKRKTLRLRAFERRLRPRARIRIPVTMPGFIGTDTRFIVRRGKRPKRVELCLRPGAKRPRACPPS